MPQRSGQYKFRKVTEKSIIADDREVNNRKSAQRSASTNTERNFDMKNRMSRNLTKLIPMNIQMYAENATAEGATAGKESVPEGDPGKTEGNEPSEPTREELLEKLAAAETRATQAEADAEKWKTANDKSSTEAANFKKQLTAKMTAQEQMDEAKKEAEEARDKRFKEMENELAVIKATDRYMTIEMNKEKAGETAKAEIAGDMEKVTANIAAHIKEIKKAAAEEAVNKFLTEHHMDIKAGSGDADKMSLAEEKAKEFAAKKSRAVNADDLKRFM